MSQGTVFERRRRPLDHRLLSFGAGLSTLGGVGLSTATASPVAASLITMLGGALTMVFGLLATERGAYGGRLHRLRRKVRLVQPAAAEGYREAHRGPDLLVDREPIPKGRAREVVLGYYRSHAGGGQSFHFWPLYLVFEDHVVELDVFRDQREALEARKALAERLELPKRYVHTGVFSTGITSGCLVMVLSVTAQLAAVIAGGPGQLFVDTPAMKLVLSSLMVLALWVVGGTATRVGAAQVRPAIDDQVRRTFGLAGPKVRVATDAEAEGEPVQRSRPGTAASSSKRE